MNGVELVASWLTPAVLFCVLNLMIGTIFVISVRKPRNNPQNARENDAVSPQQFVRVTSFFERVSSIKLSFSRSENRDTVPASTVHHEDIPNRDQARQSPEGNDFHVRRSKSDTGAKASASAPAVAMKKSASEKVQTAEEGWKILEKREELRRTGDDAVDAKADDFINRFRQQLKMQRLDSLLRYKEILKRGASA
ncbi:pathogen-associated molecular patterns-induced protein A70-like [Primulina eburnea]|uniref:pathogen-associated molecular patterns-induced protein A70-like n=1 Tax=Primulina eburnea TaxID=1245227 RepID=UPI003C6C9F63